MSRPDVTPNPEAIQRLGISKFTFYQAFRTIDPATGKIEAAKFGGDRIGRRCIVRTAGLDRYLACEPEPAPKPEGIAFLHRRERAS